MAEEAESQIQTLGTCLIPYFQAFSSHFDQLNHPPSNRNLSTSTSIMDFQPQNAPQPLLGRDGPEPDFWAVTAHDNPWPRRHIPSSTLYQIRQKSLYREPALRNSRRAFNGPRFFNAVGAKTENLEALLAQAPGPQVTPGQECVPCKQGRGPFVSCVVTLGIFSECANCHWSQQARRCSFNTDPPASFVPRGQTAPAEPGTTSATKLEEDLDRELRETRAVRDEAMALVEQLDRRIDELLEARAALTRRLNTERGHGEITVSIAASTMLTSQEVGLVIKEDGRNGRKAKTGNGYEKEGAAM
ncbi:hypothetical protein PEBR_08325 [Penicillium brasilianum]|uniref:Uncharacterized protein n=1 Tax=Penicillium brasilianum TaxID=104259 RepID=A0A1S9RWR0_PENBI|nr:hypothetical protein PEBR_08325 [Penicillium brasilianum]